MRLVIGLAIVVVALALACAPATPTPTPTSTRVAGTERTRVVQRVIDGDTFDIQLPGGATDRVRVLGVDTPEKSGNKATEYPGVTDTVCLDRWGLKATEFARSTLESRSVTLETDPAESQRDGFGRLLAYVRTDTGDYGAALLGGGYARVYTEGKAQREEAYLAVQRTARDARAGLWSCASPVTSTTGVGGVTIESVDLASEIVVIVNRGLSPVDLGGWTLVSESGNQRFTFPALVLAPGQSVRVTSGRSAVDDPPRSLRWTGSSVWNDGGDPAVLLDVGGKEVSRFP